jgi:RHS repeat-associated protein
VDSIYYFFSDSLSSTRVVTDSQGNICFDADYYPYGKEQDYVNNCTQTYKFTGYERDPETATATSGGNDYAVARHYNSRIFRFLQPDPAGMAAADPTDPQTWNRYAYVRNDPANMTDPTGMDDCGDFGCDTGGFGGGLDSGGGFGGGDCIWCEQPPSFPSIGGGGLPGLGGGMPGNPCDFIACGLSEIVPGLVESGGARLRAPYATCSC